LAEILASLVQRPAIYSRNAISYMTARSWRADVKADTIRALKSAKANGCCDTCNAGVSDIAAIIRKLFGSSPKASITSVPCGHSRVPDCLGRRLAEGVAADLGIPFVQCWADRFVDGVSHPKEFHKLPPLEWVATPPPALIVVDDVATSGWHLEEALTALRDRGVEAFGIAWIGGTRGPDRDSGKPEAPRSIFGGSGRSWAGSR
jgi:hypothetical protein